ncbi:hypothetical protein [Jiangella alba]|uniref:Uncharacterized protein n=1 Tax=Jiangella alba TaxID=561176 RepID=A0A1H5J593_9ACTN|nr:hypothetical protein [Jiangella alba]SEE47600.1 hypothetical protein SAMN04488561_1445 [Jiangella alba]
MATYEDPVRDAFEVREAMRGLAHATRHPPDRITAYRTLESLRWATDALQTTLEQLADAYDGYAGSDTMIGGDPVAGAAATRKITSRLRRGARNARRMAQMVTEAWDLEDRTDYVAPPPPGRTAWQAPAAPPPPPPPSQRLLPRTSSPAWTPPGAADDGGLGL